MEKIYFTEKTTSDYCKSFCFFLLRVCVVVFAVLFTYRGILQYSLEYGISKSFLNLFGL